MLGSRWFLSSNSASAGTTAFCPSAAELPAPALRTQPLRWRYEIGRRWLRIVDLRPERLVGRREDVPRADAAGVARGSGAQLWGAVHQRESAPQLGARLAPAAVAKIVKRTAAAAALDAARYAGHSRTMVDRYVRDAKLLDDDNATAGIGL